MTPSLLVSGPPCGGKSTLARKMAEQGSVVVDFDDIVEEVGHVRYSTDPKVTARAFDLWRARVPTANVVVWTAPRRRDRGRFRSEYGARSVVCLASMDVCLERARVERPSLWQDRVRDWFASYEPSTSGSDVVVRTD